MRLQAAGIGGSTHGDRHGKQCEKSVVGYRRPTACRVVREHRQLHARLPPISEEVGYAGSANEARQRPGKIDCGR